MTFLQSAYLRKYIICGCRIQAEHAYHLVRMMTNLSFSGEIHAFVRAPRKPQFFERSFTFAESARPRADTHIYIERERIVESNIRRTFTVRFPNLYCVWQRCRDIRGSYRNVLLLIVLHPEENGANGG